MSTLDTAIHRRVAACRAGTDPTRIAPLASGWAVLGEPQVLRGYCLLLPDPKAKDGPASIRWAVPLAFPQWPRTRALAKLRTSPPQELIVVGPCYARSRSHSRRLPVDSAHFDPS